MRPKSAKYLARARAFVEAVDIATELRATPPSKDRHLFDWYVWLKARAVPPYADPVNANLRGLAGLEDIFFTEWNEGSGEDVERLRVRGSVRVPDGWLVATSLHEADRPEPWLVRFGEAGCSRRITARPRR